MTTVAIIGAGSVGRALGRGLSRAGHAVVYGVRSPGDPGHADLGDVDTVPGAASRAGIVVLAVPAPAVPEVVASLDLHTDHVVVDATNAVRSPIPGEHPTMGDLVASLVPEGVAVAKAFDTIGAEHLSDGHLGEGAAFLPVAGDAAAVDAVLPLAEALGFDAVSLGDRSAFGMVEDHARLWIHLAYACGWGRGFGFVAVGRRAPGRA